MPYKDPDKQLEYQKNWARKRRKQIRNKVRELRQKAVEKLGGKCVYCGCDEPEALEINHKNGGGHAEYRSRCSKSIYYDVINGKRDDLELTCRICNAYHFLKIIKGLKGDWQIKWIPHVE